jgi:hypothetical protein
LFFKNDIQDTLTPENVVDEYLDLIAMARGFYLSVKDEEQFKLVNKSLNWAILTKIYSILCLLTNHSGQQADEESKADEMDDWG